MSTADDLAAVRQLKVDYAVATDAIAAGDTAAGLAVYREAFTPDARISAGFDPAAPDVVATGPEEWAAACEASFAPFSGAHHLIGSLDARADGADPDRATLTAYLTATMLPSEGRDLTRILGTYHDVAVRRDGRWRIAESFLRYFSIESGPRVAP
ncbi:MAG TPA: nuclear transport factor 2 family protein [Acidimicrobiales bacterium]|jgi:hypothetical protein